MFSGGRGGLEKVDIERSKKNALNMLINFAPQASACGMGLLAMARMRERWIEKGIWMKKVWMVNFIHDEILFEVQENILEEVQEDIRDIMEHVVQLRVPLRVDMAVTECWKK